MQIKFSEIKEKIFKIGAPSLPDSCMPIGMKSEDNKTKLVAVNLNPRDLLNHLIAISLAQVKLLTKSRPNCESDHDLLFRRLRS